MKNGYYVKVSGPFDLSQHLLGGTVYIYTLSLTCHLIFIKHITDHRGQHSFVFGRSRVEISAQRPAILTEVLVVFFSPSRQMPGYALN
jgi:hypothetical protein